MEQFHNTHKDERAFIVCNGPSINNIDVSLLNNDAVFIMNRGHLLEEKGLVTDALIANQFYDEFRELGCKRKFSNRLDKGKDITYISVGTRETIFQTDITKKIKSFNSVTVVALSIAYYMGCNPVYIVGMDHSLDLNLSKKEEESRRERYVTAGKDINHFNEKYFPKGTSYNLQNLDHVALGYKLASEAYKKDGRVLLNLSNPTSLDSEIIERGNFNEIFKI